MLLWKVNQGTLLRNFPRNHNTWQFEDQVGRRLERGREILWQETLRLLSLLQRSWTRPESQHTIEKGEERTKQRRKEEKERREEEKNTLQLGQTNPDMFSTMPRTRIPAFRQKSSSLRTSRRATSCGVVTMTAPSTPASVLPADSLACLKKVEILRCSSLVPGGVSMTKKSNSSQSTSLINCFIMPFFLGPRQMIGVSGVGNKNAVDIRDKLSRT